MSEEMKSYEPAAAEPAASRASLKEKKPRKPRAVKAPPVDSTPVFAAEPVVVRPARKCRKPKAATEGVVKPFGADWKKKRQLALISGADGLESILPVLQSLHYLSCLQVVYPTVHLAVEEELDVAALTDYIKSQFYDPARDGELS